MAVSDRVAQVAAHPLFQDRLRAIMLRTVSTAIATNAGNKAALIAAYQKIAARPENLRDMALAFGMVANIAAKITPANAGSEATDEDLTPLVESYLVIFADLFP